MNLNDFEQLTLTRRSVRNFREDPIDEQLLERLLQISQWAPSGYNLQPTHYVIVQDRQLLERLCSTCMNQRQIAQAPATIVFTGDRKVVENNLDRMVDQEKEAGIINDQYEAFLRKYVNLGFSHSPAGLGWLWKASVLPIARFFVPVPDMPAIHKKYWLAKQVMLNAMVFMLAAHSTGLATVPMEGFDESRVKKVLNIPSSHIVPLVIPVGYPASGELKKTRLPAEGFIHRNGW